MKKIGIFGGTFDPVHNGHLQLAIWAYQQYALDRVIFVPNYQNPFKDGQRITSPEHRLQMVQLALEPYPNFSVSDYELKTSTIHYTYDTMEFFKSKFPQAQLYFIAGSDILNHLDRWKHIEKLLENSPFIIGKRRDTQDILFTPFVHSYIDSFHFLEGEVENISSTKIREMVQAKKYDLVPEKVSDYIRKHRLYC